MVEAAPMGHHCQVCVHLSYLQVPLGEWSHPFGPVIPVLVQDLWNSDGHCFIRKTSSGSCLGLSVLAGPPL